jgi:hypothetical protein
VPDLQQVNVVACQQISLEEAEVEIHKVEAAEMDEMWSFVGKKAPQRWLWHAIDHTSGVILADVCGVHEAIPSPKRVNLEGFCRSTMVELSSTTTATLKLRRSPSWTC